MVESAAELVFEGILIHQVYSLAVDLLPVPQRIIDVLVDDFALDLYRFGGIKTPMVGCDAFASWVERVAGVGGLDSAALLEPGLEAGNSGCRGVSFVPGGDSGFRGGFAGTGHYRKPAQDTANLGGGTWGQVVLD